ncbi:MAG: HEAT repeat domain-containing protein [Gemmatimonadaceae bacterium]
MKLIALSIIAAAGLGLHDAASAPRLALAGPHIPDASWAPRDTADTLWRRGRIAISEEQWRDAAWHFARLVERYPASTYAGDALYWQAFAFQRVGGSSDIRSAVRALEVQKEKYPRSATYVSGESSALLTRLNGRLARSGDADAAVMIAELAAVAAQAGMAVAAEVAPMVAEEVRRAMPEIQREVSQAMREAAVEAREATAEAAANLRATARQGRRDRGDEIPPGCEGAVDDERVEALNALLQMNAEQALPILKRVLERRDRCSEILRRKAVFLVSQKRSDEAADILLNVAKTDPDSYTREQAVFWLSQTHGERAVEVLEQILVRESPDAELQKRAVFSLSQVRSERAGAILRDFIKRTDVPAEARGEAIFWLGQRRSAENASFLREVFPTLETDELREKVIFSLSQQRSPENSRWLLQQAKNTRLSGELRKSALFWAGQGGAAVADLAEIYDTSPNDRELRNQVIFTLSQRRNDTAAMDKLLDIARKEPDRELRRQAIFWIGQSRDPRAARLLEEIINNPR